MAKASPRSSPILARLVLVLGLVVLGGAVLVTAWRLRSVVWPEQTSVEIDRRLRPGRFEERAGWTQERAIEAMTAVSPHLADWDTTRTPEGLVISATLDRQLPLEEGNRLIAEALAGRGVEVCRVDEVDGSGSRPGIDLSFGLDDRVHGRIRLTAFAEPLPYKPRVALVLDDLGQNDSDVVRGLLEADFPLTTTILPGRPRSREIATRSRTLGREVLLHLPMEPMGYPQVNPGDDAVLVDMSRSRIRRLVGGQLDELPEVTGVSNHMGSMATQDRAVMEAVLDEVGERKLYFLDSHTTSRSIVPRIAREREVPCVVNDLFLDHVVDEGEIRRRMAQLVAMARSQGSAVGIFHPHPECLAAIPGEVERYRREGVEFVTPRELGYSRWIGALPPAR